MPGELEGKKVAILLTEGVEQVEALEPKRALEEAGATTHIVAPEEGRVRAWNHTEWGDEIEVDVSLDRASPADYDALVLPGGVMNPDKLRPEERSASTSNRNFEGRQGRGGRTHLVSPAVAAATAIAGHFATPEDL